MCNGIDDIGDEPKFEEIRWCGYRNVFTGPTANSVNEYFASGTGDVNMWNCYQGCGWTM